MDPSDAALLAWLDAQADGVDSMAAEEQSHVAPEEERQPILPVPVSDPRAQVVHPSAAPTRRERPVRQPQARDGDEVLKEAIEEAIKELGWFDPPCALYRNWVPLIAQPVEAGRKARGKQVEGWNIASICTGVSPEDKMAGLFGCNHRLVFTNDTKGWSIKWIKQNNFRQPDQHIIDLNHLRTGGYAYNWDGEAVDLKEILKDIVIDLLVAGISCKANSLARSGRTKDIWSHPDTWMIPAFLDVLLLTDTEAAWLENVGGFLRTDERSGISPLLCLLQLAHDKKVLERWSVTLFNMDGSTFLVWDRQRVWLLFLKRSAGPEAKRWIMIMVQDFSLCFLRPKLFK